MTTNWYFVMAVALGASFVLSVVLTELARRAALRWSFLDQPGERKVHVAPVPLMGGAAIWFSFYAVILGTFAVLAFMRQFGDDWLLEQFEATFGDNGGVKLTGLLAGGLVIFVLGVVDDLKILSPEVKLAGQIVAALVLVLSGMRIEMFIFRNIWVSSALTVLWVVMLTNSLNFLDNMDGLAGGVSVIAAFSFFLAVQPYEYYLVRLVLVIFAGAVAGFLYHNLNPAKIFMGDAGAMFCGYMLASVAIMGTFHIESTPSPIAVAAPLLALSVPLFDISSVVVIRWRRGESIMKGDKRHFSHRLVRLGMSPKQAVEFIFLVAGVTGLSGALLGRLNQRGVLIVLAQTVGIYLLIVLLMKANRKNGDADGA